MTSSGNRSEITTERSLSLDGLLPCTEYKFKVAAKSSLGVGTYSEEIVFTTSTKGTCIIFYKNKVPIPAIDNLFLSLTVFFLL